MFRRDFPFFNAVGGFYPPGNDFPLSDVGWFCCAWTGVSSDLHFSDIPYFSVQAGDYLRKYFGYPVSYALFCCISHLHKFIRNQKLTYPAIERLDSRKSSGIGYTSKVRVRDKYHIVGFISSGTYGRVYKAVGKQGQKGEFAIKK